MDSLKDKSDVELEFFEENGEESGREDALEPKSRKRKAEGLVDENYTPPGPRRSKRLRSKACR